MPPVMPLSRNLCSVCNEATASPQKVNFALRIAPVKELCMQSVDIRELVLEYVSCRCVVKFVHVGQWIERPATTKLSSWAGLSVQGTLYNPNHFAMQLPDDAPIVFYIGAMASGHLTKEENPEVCCTLV